LGGFIQRIDFLFKSANIYKITLLHPKEKKMEEIEKKQADNGILVRSQINLQINGRIKPIIPALVKIDGQWYTARIKGRCAKSAIGALAKRYGKDFCVVDLVKSLIALEKSLLVFIYENRKITLDVLEYLCQKAVAEATQNSLTNEEKRRYLDAFALLAKDFDDNNKQEFADFIGLIEETRRKIAPLCKLLRQEKKGIKP